MIKNIFIGADGGGTKTKIIVEDEAGLLLGQARSGPANIRNSVEQAWSSIDAGVKEALNQANLDPADPNYHFHIGLGLAGTEDPVASAGIFIPTLFLHDFIAGFGCLCRLSRSS